MDEFAAEVALLFVVVLRRKREADFRYQFVCLVNRLRVIRRHTSSVAGFLARTAAAVLKRV
jgi:hypothetical protein